MSNILIFIVILFAIDLYVYLGIRGAYLSGPSKADFFTWIYCGFALILYLGTAWSLSIGGHRGGPGLNNAIIVVVFLLLTGKLLFSVFLLIDDLGRGIRWIISLFNPSIKSENGGISRFNFIVSTGLMVGTGMVAALSYGIARGAHNYRIVRREITLPKLPASFDGLRLVQISDIHSGSFWNKTAVERGIRMVMEQKADIIFFTGDLVNNLASEMDEYKDLFRKIKAPLGVYSVLGNHDYAAYLPEITDADRQKSIQDLIALQREMGWDVLMNENRIIRKGKDQIAVLGIENWSAHDRFPKYGKLDKAYSGTEDSPVKLLLSHDPSHWKAQVLKEYPDISMMFAGHTHGMQFGIETGGFQWSPVKYIYPEWAGLYIENDQYLYVNRGFGYIGYPGRLGIRPEITVFEFRSA